jgi:hypothetical protein
VVFGVNRDDKDTFVENHTDDFIHCLLLADIMSTADYKARIWDNEDKRFIPERVIDRAMRFLSQ